MCELQSLKRDARKHTFSYYVKKYAKMPRIPT